MRNIEHTVVYADRVRVVGTDESYVPETSVAELSQHLDEYKIGVKVACESHTSACPLHVVALRLIEAAETKGEAMARESAACTRQLVLKRIMVGRKRVMRKNVW
jgi:hypothetical protein